MIVVGLTGGIASGKSTITNFLKKKKFPVHDSDSVVKKIYSNPSQKFLSHLKKTNLQHAVKGKKINKEMIRNEIFKNKRKKTKLEKFIHGEVKKSRDLYIKKNKAKKTKMLFIDVPLLFESKLTHLCDYIVLLYVPNKIKIKRCLKRKGMNKKIILRILKNQMGDRYKKKKSDFVINTSKTKKNSFKMILSIIDNIKNQNA